MKPIQQPASDARIVILTGAGISQESGLETFRDPDGIWSKVRIEDVATPEAFAADPDRVHAFYNMRRKRALTLNLEPNAAHKALAELEARWPGEVLVVTQNVDSFHERAGTTNLIHMHGRHAEARCNHCSHVVPWSGDMSVDVVCEGCAKPGGIRPNVVWFGEMPLQMDRIQAALFECDLFISIGTSGNVYPAAGFVGLMRKMGRGHTVELNLEPSTGASLFAESHYGKATDIVPRYVAALLNDQT
ncbi:MAG: NAD-dependent deacylase [Rhodospirillaceae bacterium]|nr:NAD-dependent deacylase [Rhodospirillaceae bacterium]